MRPGAVLPGKHHSLRRVFLGVFPNPPVRCVTSLESTGCYPPSAVDAASSATLAIMSVLHMIH